MQSNQLDCKGSTSQKNMADKSMTVSKKFYERFSARDSFICGYKIRFDSVQNESIQRTCSSSIIHTICLHEYEYSESFLNL